MIQQARYEKKTLVLLTLDISPKSNLFARIKNVRDGNIDEFRASDSADANNQEGGQYKPLLNLAALSWPQTLGSSGQSLGKRPESLNCG
jgi:hypothetical protein